jgi:hypothetical protein
VVRASGLVNPNWLLMPNPYVRASIVGADAQGAAGGGGGDSPRRLLSAAGLATKAERCAPPALPISAKQVRAVTLTLSRCEPSSPLQTLTTPHPPQPARPMQTGFVPGGGTSPEWPNDGLGHNRILLPKGVPKVQCAAPQPHPLASADSQTAAAAGGAGEWGGEELVLRIAAPESGASAAVAVRCVCGRQPLHWTATAARRSLALGRGQVQEASAVV